MNTRPSLAGELWRKQIDRQSNSGLSVAAFCRRHSIAVATFYFWKRRLGEPEHSSAFVEVRQPPANEVAAPTGTSDGTHPGIELPAKRFIELYLRGGRRLRLRRGFDRRLLLDVLAPLEGVS